MPLGYVVLRLIGFIIKQPRDRRSRVGTFINIGLSGRLRVYWKNRGKQDVVPTPEITDWVVVDSRRNGLFFFNNNRIAASVDPVGDGESHRMKGTRGWLIILLCFEVMVR